MPKKKSVKKTSKRLATIAGKYAAMDDAEMLAERLANRKKFYANVRALAASVLVQYESEKKKVTK